MQVCSDPVILKRVARGRGSGRDPPRRTPHHAARRALARLDRRRRHGPGPRPDRAGSWRFAPTTGTCGRRWGSPREACSTSPRPTRTTGEPSTPSPWESRCRPPRAVENFLDIAHFPYVHGGVLGEEPRTEVAEYRVEERDGELWAFDCLFYQPRAAAASAQAVLASYVYRVPHPYCAMLYKSSPSDAERMDAIGIFIHPLTETRIRAHLFVSVLDDVSTDGEIRRFQQGVIAQDKPILENQHPKLLPLDPRAETPIRADRSAIVLPALAEPPRGDIRRDPGRRRGPVEGRGRHSFRDVPPGRVPVDAGLSGQSQRALGQVVAHHLIGPAPDRHRVAPHQLMAGPAGRLASVGHHGQPAHRGGQLPAAPLRLCREQLHERRGRSAAARPGAPRSG